LNNERTAQTENTVALMRTTLDTVTITNMAMDKNVAKGFFCMSGFFLKPRSQLKYSVSTFWLSIFSNVLHRFPVCHVSFPFLLLASVRGKKIHHSLPLSQFTLKSV